MGRFCGYCGREMAQCEAYCPACGIKFEEVAAADKKKLTNKVIEDSLIKQKHTVWQYLGHFALLALMVVVVYLGRPDILLLMIPWLITLIKMICHDIKLGKLKYCVLERQCVKKDIKESDDGPEVYYRLWFRCVDEDYVHTVLVEQNFYEDTVLGEEFFVVFLLKDKQPHLCYRKKEWIR